MTRYFIGIDVGTGSARAGVFDEAGTLVGTYKRDITVFHEPGSIVEQSSNEIWQAVSAACRGARRSSSARWGGSSSSSSSSS